MNNRHIGLAKWKVTGYHIIVLSILLAAVSCKKEPVSTVEVSKKKVSIFAGIVDTVTILSGGSNWSANVRNPAVASVAIHQDKLIVTSYNAGKTIIYLSNERQRLDIELEVNTLSGGWYIRRNSNAEPVIEADDPEVEAEIAEELFYEEVNRVRRAYFFSNNGVCNVQTVNMTNEEREQFEGSFLLQNSVLTVSYNNFDHIYTLENPPQIGLLKQDLTSYYQQKFPAAGVKKVYVFMALQYFTYG